MAKDRLTLQAELRKFAPKAYFKRPPDNKMEYPCFVYRPSRPKTARANNHMYMYMPAYNVIYISQTENEDIERQLLEHFEHCQVDRQYESDGLYHRSFVIYW